MAALRLVLALALLAGLAAGAAALVVSLQAGPGADGEFRVQVVGPEGVLLERAARLEGATALGALEAAAAAEGLTVEVRRYPGMGEYVVAVGPWRAAGSAGWVYEVLRGGEWLNGDRSAADFPLEPGDAVRWTWTGG